jgi:LysM repeat protein
VAQPTPSQCAALYVVRTKDTAFSIARRFGISLADLAAANNLASASEIKIGQLLILPGVPGPSSSTHVVQKGDTLYSIARRYGTSVETIAALNQLPHPWHAPLGRTLTLCLP